MVVHSADSWLAWWSTRPTVGWHGGPLGRQLTCWIAFDIYKSNCKIGWGESSLEGLPGRWSISLWKISAEDFDFEITLLITLVLGGGGGRLSAGLPIGDTEFPMKIFGGTF
eukprot:NODE_1150_length_1998_cov_3.677199.p1 type:complete len:111 gc:universal NODE_1150_length_1998_cov_3.677199:224-556(+)